MESFNNIKIYAVNGESWKSEKWSEAFIVLSNSSLGSDFVTLATLDGDRYCVAATDLKKAIQNATNI